MAAKSKISPRARKNMEESWYRVFNISRDKYDKRNLDKIRHTGLHRNQFLWSRLKGREGKRERGQNKIQIEFFFFFFKKKVK